MNDELMETTARLEAELDRAEARNDKLARLVIEGDQERDELTPAVKALVDRARRGDWTARELAILAEAVRSEQTWPGAVNMAEAVRRYPEILQRATSSPYYEARPEDMLLCLNRARADGAVWIYEQVGNEPPGTWAERACIFIRKLLPQSGPR